MDWWHLQAVFFDRLAAALPWLLGGFALFGGIYLSPLGRSAIRYLRANKRDAAVSEAILAELIEQRGTLGEVIERLDATERELRSGRLLSTQRLPTTPVPLTPEESPIPTPH